jgi:hypothetical protein
MPSKIHYILVLVAGEAGNQYQNIEYFEEAMPPRTPSLRKSHKLIDC